RERRAGGEGRHDPAGPRRQPRQDHRRRRGPRARRERRAPEPAGDDGRADRLLPPAGGHHPRPGPRGHGDRAGPQPAPARPVPDLPGRLHARRERADRRRGAAMSARFGGRLRGRLRGGAARGPDTSTMLKALAFVAVTGLLTFSIGQMILGTSFRDRYELTATFDDVTGLLEGDDVKVAGTPVGRVESIEVVRGKAVVGMKIDREVRIPADSTAAIRWRNVMGQRVIYLEPGREEAKLRDGDRVPHTRSVVDLGDIVNALGPLTRNLDPNQLNKILFSFSQALEGNEQNISALTDNMDVLLQTFAARKKTIERMIDDYETISETVAKRDKQIAASVDNLESLT